MRKLISFMTIFITTSTVPISVVACGNNLSNNLNKILSHCDLGVIDSYGMSVPTTNELEQAIKDKNPGINVNALKFEHRDANSATVLGDGITYVGQKTVKFNLKDKIAITDIIPNGTHINTIVQTEGKSSPSQSDITDALKIEYADNLNIEKISISGVTKNQATITSDGTTYTGTSIISFDINVVTELSKVITNPKIGTILTQGNDTPTSDQIITTLVKQYATLNTKAIKIDNITTTSAVVSTTDFAVYSPDSTVTLSFITDKHMNFNKILKDRTLGEIHIDPKAKFPTPDQIKLALKANNLNPDLNVSYIKVDQITTTSAQISSTDQKYYKGDPITVNYKVNTSTDLNIIIPKANRDLGTFKFPPDKTVPEAKDITDKLKQYSLNLDKIVFNQITTTSAVLSSSDQSVYTGSVTLTYKVDSSVSLDSVLTVKELGSINTNGLPVPALDTLVKTIVSVNNKVNSTYITVSDITNTSAKVTGDNTHYIGSITVNFIIDNSTITNSISYKDSKDYAAQGSGTSNKFDGKQKTILANWTNYAKNWDDFTKAFPKLSFGKDATFEIWMNTCDDKKLSGDQLTFDTNKINTDDTNKAFSLSFHYDYKPVWFVLWSADLNAYVTIWHDNTNVYLNWHGSMSVSKIASRDSQFAINFPEADFHK